MLRMMLHSHPEITCYGEVITLKGSPNLGRCGKTKEELNQSLAADPVRFLYECVWGGTNRPAIGCKIKYRQLEEQFPGVFDAILADKSIKIIHLRRKNLLKRYVSNRLAASQKTPTVILSKRQETNAGQQRITIDLDKCLADIEHIKKSEQDFIKYFADHSVFEVFYEDLTVPASPDLLEMQAFLGVKPISIQPKTVKVNSNKLEEVIENYEFIRNKLAGTVYGGYL